MALNIYDKSGRLKLAVEPADSSTHQHGIMEDNVVNLSFTLSRHIMLDVGDYTQFDNQRYWMIESYVPQQKSTVEWSYSTKFYGIESLMKLGLMLKLVDGEMLPIFTLTAPAREHLKLFVDNLNRIMLTTDYKVGECIATENLVIDYNSTYLHEGLSKISEASGTEWWFDGMTVNLTRCERNAEITLGYRNGLTRLERTTANGIKFFTRLYPLGSTRNIDPTVYGHSRLQLSGGHKYVEQNTATYGIIEHSEETAFSHIYPRRTGTISSVRDVEKTGQDGKPFKVYYFKDSGLNFDPNTYEIANLVKQVSFVSGELNGRDFEVNYDSETKEFEIITQFPDETTQLPNDILKPEPGNKYILWNIKMPDEYITLAENEYKTAVDAYMADSILDKSVYKAPTDYIDIQKRNIPLIIGQRVRLESDSYFPGTGYRNSRITKISRKINNPTQADIEISDVLSKGKVTSLENSVNNIKTIIESTRDGLPDIIKSWEGTPPTDSNLFSSLRVLKEIADKALSRVYEDIAAGHITFDKGFTAHDFAIYYKGIVKEYISSEKFIPGFAGEGMKIWLENGQWNAEFDNLVVRQSMTIYELIISKIRAVNGGFVISAASGRIKSVSKTTGSPQYYVIGIEGDLEFAIGDLVRHQVFGSNNPKYFWVEVKSIGTDYILCLVSDFGSAVPTIGDDIVQMGNTINVKRQGLIYLTASEDGKPRVQILDGVNSTNLSGKNKTILGCLDGITDTNFPAENQPQGYGLYSDNAYLRGDFILKNGKDVSTELSAVSGQITLAVNSIKLGGRNILVGSSNGKGWTPEAWKGENTFSRTSASIAETYIYSPYITIPGNTEIVLSFEHKEDIPITYCEFYLLPDNHSSIGLLRTDYTKSTEWKKEEFKFKTPAGWGNGANVRMRVDHNGSTGGVSASIWIKNIMLEYGNKAADFTPPVEDIDDSISGIEKRISSAELKITDEAIRSTVKSQTETIAKSTVDSLEFGSRNLIPNSNFIFGIAGLESPRITVERVSYFEGDLLYEPYAIILGAKAGLRDVYTNEFGNTKLKPNTSYILSMWMKCAGDISGSSSYIFLYNDTGDNYILSSIPISPSYGGYKKISVQFTTDTTNLNFRMRFGYGRSQNMGASWMLVNCVKLEEGNKATDWSPAPEDTVKQATNYSDNNFPTKVTFETEIKQLSDSISLKATKTEVNGIVDRVSEAEIALRPDNIQLAVKPLTEQQVSQKSNVINLFRDGSFEYGYTLPSTTSNAPNVGVRPFEGQDEAPQLYGKKCLFVKMWGSGDSYFYLNQNTPVVGGRKYTIVFWHHDGGAPGGSSSYLYDSTGKHYSMPITWSYGWHKQVWKYTAPANATWVQIRFGRNGTAAAWSLFDGIMILEGDLEYTPDT